MYLFITLLLCKKKKEQKKEDTLQRGRHTTELSSNLDDLLIVLYYETCSLLGNMFFVSRHVLCYEALRSLRSSDVLRITRSSQVTI